MVAGAHIHNSAFVTARNKSTVLQVIPALDAGGAERTTIDIARALTAENFRALVATEGGRLERELSAAAADVFHMPLDSKAPHTLVANAARLTRVIRREDVSLIHARSRAPAWSALIAARATGIPFVTTYHGIYNANNPLKQSYNSVMARGDIVIANSQWTADHVMREHGTARERIVVVHRGVDLEQFDPAGVSPSRVEAVRTAWGIAPTHHIVLLSGRLTRWKGQLVLIDAAAQLAREGALGNTKMVLAGDAQGRDTYVSELRNAIEANGLASVVKIADHVTDMPAAYLAIDIVVSASTDPEAFGRVAAEAGAMARPVIATDHGGARETVLKNESGLLTPPGDTTALATALKAMLDMGDERRREMGARGRAHVRANFSLEQMCAQTLTIYQDLLSRRRAG
jgi:glycosyltransferase involved in cell wall biosynthesis